VRITGLAPLVVRAPFQDSVPVVELFVQVCDAVNDPVNSAPVIPSLTFPEELLTVIPPEPNVRARAVVAFDLIVVLMPLPL
jgi:hypothetical protein